MNLLDSLLGGSIGISLGPTYQQVMQQYAQGAAQANMNVLAGMANAQAQYVTPRTPAEIAEEEARKVCAVQMRDDWKVKRFMEKALPIDWCKRLYPEAYEART